LREGIEMPRKKKTEEPVVNEAPKKKPGRPKKSDAAVAAEIEVKKATLDIVIESPMGGAISTDEIAKRVPKGTEAVYVRVDENKLYWVKGKKTGDIDIWE
jgi:hypothetical protein